MSKVEDIQNLITSNQRRLQILKEQQALTGISTEPKIVLEIENIEGELAKLQIELAEAKAQEAAVASAPTSRSHPANKTKDKNTPQTNERRPLVYQDFNIRFSHYNPTDGSFKVWVEGETSGGTMKPDDAIQCSYKPTTFWKEPITGTGGLIGKIDRRRITRDELFMLGQLLADLALPEGSVRRLFEQSVVTLKPDEGLRLRLHLDPVELTHLPWEYLALPQTSGEQKDTDFLALRREISIARTDTVEAPARSLPDRAKVRVVGVVSSPDGQDELNVDQEKKLIEEAVQTLNKAAGHELIEVKWAQRPATRQAVEQALAEGADIFHYAGHAIFELESRQGKIILEDQDYASDFYGGEQLAQLLRGAGSRLVILSACETGRRNGQNVWGGVAPALTRERIPAVIANQFKIEDKNALLIAAKVYHRVLAGYTVDEALYEARETIYQQNGLENRDWGVPVLYLHDQTGVLFPRPGAGSVEEAAGNPFIRVTNSFNTVKGEVIDVEIGTVIRGHLEIADTIDVVEEGGKFTSLKIDTLG